MPVQMVGLAVTYLFDPREALGFQHASRPLELPEVGFQLTVGRQPNVLGPKLVQRGTQHAHWLASNIRSMLRGRRARGSELPHTWRRFSTYALPHLGPV